MEIQRLRNLTTGRLHTKMEHVYKDIEYFTDVKGIMTHMLPRASLALDPFLRKRIPDLRFWDGSYDPTHAGDIDVSPLNEREKKEFWDNYNALPNPLERLGSQNDA